MTLDIAVPPKNGHPATYSKYLWETLVNEMRGGKRVLDPMSGIGLIHPLAEAAGVAVSVGVELQGKWSNYRRFRGPYRLQVVGDMFEVVPTLGNFTTIVVSPSYGNRMADNHNAVERCKACKGTGYIRALTLDAPDDKETCPKCDGEGKRVWTRNTYTHRHGSPLKPNSSSILQWGDEYREWHREAWAVCNEALLPGGKFILNVKNHIRNHVEMDVAGFHHDTLIDLGYELIEDHQVSAKGNRQGANHKSRVEYETVFVFRKGKR